MKPAAQSAPYRRASAARIAFALLAMLALSSCATAPRAVVAPATAAPELPPAIGVYAPVPGREPETITPLRAGAPPAQVETIDSTDYAGDELRLREQGMVRVATGSTFSDDEPARAWLREHAAIAGADVIVMHHPASDAPVVHSFETDAVRLHAAYFVRIKPPFGATFRDLSAAERARFRVRGGARIGNVIGGSPAADANLITGDIVLHVGGIPVLDRAQFQAALRAKAGRAVALTVQRDGVTFTRTVRLGELPAAVP
jgi:membrane-associated protease RseP (regulator of RpoE activity)